jgi:hypothetical protein
VLFEKSFACVKRAVILKNFAVFSSLICFL